MAAQLRQQTPAAAYRDWRCLPCSLPHTCRTGRTVRSEQVSTLRVLLEVYSWMCMVSAFNKSKKGLPDESWQALPTSLLDLRSRRC